MWCVAHCLYIKPNNKPRALPIKQIIANTARKMESQPIDVFEPALVMKVIKKVITMTIAGTANVYLIVFLNPFLSTRANTNKPINMAIGLNVIANSMFFNSNYNYTIVLTSYSK